MSRLLFVEDDRDDEALTRLGFKNAGFTHDIAVARDGREALDLLESALAAGEPLPDVILTDLKMPRMTGLELLRALTAAPRLRSIPVVFLTSSGNEDDQREASTLGARRYLRKPSNLDDYKDIAAVVTGLMPAKVL